ncbi:hypothetical protein [Pseudosulfitobacter koreensis]|uniref:Type I restriction enzyme R protein N terminus (HSDR_N) n=1 Tax=Pseudosulfitobacter koreensis TaxID=2968472 RepID=A0ABT1YWJ6_9RHOB|nr:hypothetical protein [Pseudosulfitobacter koreense]MCR8825242.1 hypothetical protein [Pseudosulfitobacter koreense]
MLTRIAFERIERHDRKKKCSLRPYRMPPGVNQNPEQLARDRINERLRASGWHVQDKEALDFNAGLGVAVREYQTDKGPADYVLFVDRHAVGVVEAKPDNRGVRLTSVEEQSEGYANAKLKWVTNAEPLPFLYESACRVTRFVDRNGQTSELTCRVINPALLTGPPNQR